MGFRNPITRLSELVADVITGGVFRTRETGRRVEIGSGTGSEVFFYPDDAVFQPGIIQSTYVDPTNTGYGSSSLLLGGPQEVGSHAAQIRMGEVVEPGDAFARVTIDADEIWLNAGILMVDGAPFTPPQAGVETLTYGAATQTQNVVIWFPSVFDNAPVVTVTPTDARFTLAIVSVSPASVTIQARYLLGAAVAGFSLGVAWVALEAT